MFDARKFVFVSLLVVFVVMAGIFIASFF